MSAPTPAADAAVELDGDAIIRNLAAKLADAHVQIAVLESQIANERAARLAAQDTAREALQEAARATSAAEQAAALPQDGSADAQSAKARR